MAIKRILLPIHVDGSFEPLSSTAFLLGETFGAQVEGLYAQPGEFLIQMVEGWRDPEEIRLAIAAIQEQRREGEAKANALFKAKVERFPNVETTLHTVPGEVETIFTKHGRLADISVICSHHAFDAAFWSDVQNAVLFRSGRPVLLVPSTAHDPNPGKVIIAWKNSLEAARAIAAAQPFMEQATEVYLIGVEEPGSPTPELGDVEEYLQLHYDEVCGRVLPASARSVGEQLLEEAKRLDALLVMGAFSHWRLRERLLGGVTDDIFRKANVPVLMMH